MSTVPVEGEVVPTGTPTIKEIAAKRGRQTLAQGLAVDVGIGLALLLLTEVIPAMSSWQAVMTSWSVWLLLIIRTSIQSVASWFIRRYQDNSGVEKIAAPAVIVGEAVDTPEQG